MVDITSLVQAYPRVSIIVFALLISFLISLVNYFFLDKERMKEIKEKQKKVQEQIKEHQKAGNHDKTLELNKELMSHTGEMLRHSFKPMLITLIPIIFLFGIIKNNYAETTIASTWFWWYLISAIISSMVFRKIFKLP